MNISFDSAAVQKWAKFSGDNNPIHFDLDAAAKAGGDGLIVHGMLVLLPIKQALTERTPDFGAGVWTRMQASFRRPVPQSVKLSTRIRQTAARTHYAVVDSHGAAAYFEGVLSGGAPPEVLPEGLETIFSHEDLVRRWNAFMVSFPGLSAKWIVLDAMIFSVFIKNHVPIFSQNILKVLGSDKSSETLLPVAVQTNQSVWFDRLAIDAITYPKNLGLTCRCALIDSLIDGSRAMGTVGLEAWLNGKRVLYSRLGLLMKMTPGNQ